MIGAGCNGDSDGWDGLVGDKLENGEEGPFWLLGSVWILSDVMRVRSDAGGHEA